jgi:hypothetical protein
MSEGREIVFYFLARDIQKNECKNVLKMPYICMFMVHIK